MLLCGYDSGRPLPDKFPLQNICNVRVQHENTYPSELILVEFRDLKTHEQVDPTLFKEFWTLTVCQLVSSAHDLKTLTQLYGTPSWHLFDR